MLELLGQKIVVVKTYKENGVLKARRNLVGWVIDLPVKNIFVEGISIPVKMVVFRQSNGNILEVPMDYVKPYEKKSVDTYKTMSDRDLLDKFEVLVAKEIQAKSVKTKSYEKLLKDIEKVRNEILHRMCKI